MYKTLFISPMIPSYNLKVTGKFFKEILGFTSLMETLEYAIYAKDQLTIHLLPAGPDVGQMEFYMEIDNVDGLWEQIKDKLIGLRVRAPFNQTYGMREIHIGVPETKTLLFIGQDL